MNGVPVMGLAETYPAGAIGTHSHDHAQLIYAAEGVLTISTSDGSWMLPTNRALWIPAGQAHAMHQFRRVELRTLYLDEALDWVPKMPRPAVFSVSALMREIILDIAQSPWATTARPDHLKLAHVLCERIALRDTEPMHIPIPKDERARKFTEIYLSDPADRRSVKTAAAHAGASSRTLERLFRSETGLSPNEWVTQLRMIRALEMIVGSETISNASFAVGFENPSSFIAMFRRHFGTTPARYVEVTL